MARIACVVTLAVCFFLLCDYATGNQRQEGDEAARKDNNLELEICKDKVAGEWFRLVAGEGDSCRDVVLCTTSGIQTIRCPVGLFFDIEKQSCNWRNTVKNCNLKNKDNFVETVLYEESGCQDGFLACNDSKCIERSLFCNGKKDCADGSDENACDINNDFNAAPPCDISKCQLPDCFCSEDGTIIPGGLPAQDVPQMITITFNGAFNNKNIELYKEIFNGKRKNPNGCDIKATFFISHKYTNYSAVQETHKKGHEIAVNSITHNEDPQYWSRASVDDWASEMAGMRVIIEEFANITDNSVAGIRAPNLRNGGNNEFTMIQEQFFLYDSSIIAPLSDLPLWPYSLESRMPHSCIQNCPTRSHSVWELVMNELDQSKDTNSDESLSGCAMVDNCSNIVTGEEFYNFLQQNFDRHYDQNRAPLGLHFHPAWLKKNPEFFEAFLTWIDEILSTYDDVYFVTMSQVLQWVRHPRIISEAKNFEPWRAKCAVEEQSSCSELHTCKLTSKELPGETFKFQSCVKCPVNYPWLLDFRGDGNY